MLLINKTLLRLARGLWGWILAMIVIRFLTLIGITEFSKIIAGSLGDMFDPHMTLDTLWPAIVSAFLMALLMFLSQLAQGELEYRTTAAARTRLRKSIFSKVLELDAGHIENIGPVSAITSSVDAVENIQSYYSSYLPSLIFSVIAPLYLFFTLRGTHIAIALILLGVALVLLPINNVFRARIEDLRKVYWASVEDMTAYYLDSVRGLSTLKLFERTVDRRQVLGEKAEKLNKDINAFMKVNFTSFLVTEGLIYAAILVSAGIAVSAMVRGDLSLSQTLTVLLLSYSFFSSIRQLMNATHSALTSVAAAGKVAEIFAVDTTRPYDPNLPMVQDAPQGIALEQVDFHYEGRGQTLSNVDLVVANGQVTALCGLSGCGKSTIASLLMKFNDPDQGRLLFEGKDYRSFRPEELRRHIAMVPQTVTVFSGTLRENLLIAKEDATEQELLAVLEDAALGDFVRSEPLGLDCNVGDAGSRLSGGQKQKIGIARALLSDAEYIIFDEATSSVDIESEQEIWNCIHRLAKTRTLVIISHRLSSIADADCIYMIDHGRIREAGRHEDLLRNHDLYYELVMKQKEEGAQAL